MPRTAITSRLEELGMTQADLAEKTGLSRGYINDLVHGRKGERIGADALQRLTKALKVRPIFLSAAFAQANENSKQARKSELDQS